MACIPHDDRCPADMVAIPERSLCVDRFEASRSEEGVALSVRGSFPWLDIVWEDARAACESVGKRLCSADEWLEACRGPDRNTYAYGDEFEPLACNGEENTPEERYPTKTGTMPSCEGGYPGLFDLMGNAWEWTDDCDEYVCHFRGGSFEDTDVDLHCSTLGMGAPSVEFRNVGFRCCKSF
jgi:formylglycine-generating enzyme required for sulfatase activity